MASIRKRSGKYQVRVKLTGFPVQSKTFNTRADAERWARGVERDLDVGNYQPATKAPPLRFGDLLKRYRAEISPTKKGGGMEVIRLKAMERRKIAQIHLSVLDASHLIAYRDSRMAEVSGATVNRDLDDISAVLNHAAKEWRMSINNPVRQIRRPVKGKGRARILSPEEEE